MLTRLLTVLTFVATLSIAGAASTPNQLTKAEAAAGWKLLWDGQTLNGWHGVKPAAVDARWKIADGVLTIVKNSGQPGTDLVSDEAYSDFEWIVEFKVSPGANSGIKTFVTVQKSVAVGLEYQIIDDDLHPDAKLGKDGNRTLGSLYDLYPAPKTKPVKAVGEWNTARIVSRGKHVEHWLNGTKLVEYDRGSEDFRRHVAESKFKNMPNFGELPSGLLLLQDHGDEVSFRSIKLRSLAAGK